MRGKTNRLAHMHSAHMFICINYLNVQTRGLRGRPHIKQSSFGFSRCYETFEQRHRSTPPLEMLGIFYILASRVKTKENSASSAEQQMSHLIN